MYIQVKSATAIHLKKGTAGNIKNNSRKPLIKTIMGGFWLLFVDRRRQGATAALL